MSESKHDAEEDLHEFANEINHNPGSSLKHAMSLARAEVRNLRIAPHTGALLILFLSSLAVLIIVCAYGSWNAIFG